MVMFVEDEGLSEEYYEAGAVQFTKFNGYRNLMRDIYCCGTEWSNYSAMQAIPWDHTPILRSLMEGELAKAIDSGKFVHLFGSTEARLLTHEEKAEHDIKDDFVLVPVITAAISDVTLPEELAIKAVQMDSETIVPFRRLKMDWIPFGLGSAESRIRFLTCRVRPTALSRMSEENVREYEYCSPYIVIPKDYVAVCKREANEAKAMVTLETKIHGKDVIIEYCEDLDGTPKEKIIEVADEYGEEKPVPKPEKSRLLQELKDAIIANAAKVEEDLKKKLAVVDKIPKKRQAAYDSMRLVKFYPMGPIKPQPSPTVSRYYGKAHSIITE
ncbi:hypothetical protein J8273_3777 [Carpediemonas membranifera]|uniref:Uncharacterized protein n=1 Tax=Carpediemonas membranifera TaxID=201153 RepID=A0A8J6AYW0_9EUKA|nr:hypothetical protein J8273_3777 [Carpediemonas membranifera]|eukprot:KAG9394800.1 hypothetical protein J8273_3777 [Carpediemonas membranifera]